ncbi:MAG: hypothetical protein ABSG84_10225 [Acidobacteriaceae bacterium]
MPNRTYCLAAALCFAGAGVAQSAPPAATHGAPTKPVQVAPWVMAQHLTHEVRPILGGDVNDIVIYKVAISRNGDVTSVEPPQAKAMRLHPEVVAAIR